MRGNTTGELSVSTTTMKRENQESNSFNKQSKNSDHAAQFLGRFFTSLDWNYYSNVIGALIAKIFAPSTAIVATSISLEIPNTEAQRSKCNFNYKRQNEILTDLYRWRVHPSFCQTQVSRIPSQ